MIDESKYEQPAGAIIAKFGGLSKLATAINRPVSTVQGWGIRGRIPLDHWRTIIEAAEQQDIVLSTEDFMPPAERAA